MINNAYNNTIAEKSQQRETSCMGEKAQFLEEIFWYILAPIKQAVSQWL